MPDGAPCSTTYYYCALKSLALVGKPWKADVRPS